MPRRPAHGQEEEATDEVAQAETGIRGEDSREEPDHSETREAGKSDKRDNKKRSKDKKGEIRKDKRKKDKKDKKDKKEKAKRHELKAFGRAKDRKRKQTAEEKEREWNSFLSFELNEAPSQPSSNLPDAGITFEVSQHETRPAPADPISSDPVHDPVMELRRRIEQLLVSSGGESTVGRAEAKLRTTLNSKVLSSFSITPASDRSTSNAIIRLTAKQACALLEEPSLQLAALEESYFALGEEVLQSGLDFSNEDRFRDLFDDFLAKREDLRMASQRMEPKKPYIPRTRRAKRSHRDLPPMTEDEKNLLHDVRRVMKALSHDTWIPLSQLLEDAKIRRARWKLPLGLSLWQWLSLRCDEQLTTVNQGSDMLLQLSEGAVPQKGLRMSNEERRQQLSEAVFETLAVLQRDFPQGGGLDVDDLRQVPAVSRLQFERAALIQALKKQRTLEVSSRGGRLMVRLRDAPQQGEPKERNGPVKTIDRLETEKVDGTVPEPGASKSLIPDRPLPINVADWQREQEYWFKGMKPLPEGWIRCLSRNSKQMYYYDTKNCKSASQEPQEPAQPRTPMAMPG